MRRLTLYLSLLLIFTIPLEGSIAIAGVGTLTRLIGFVFTGLWVLTAFYTGQVRRPHLFHLALFIFLLWNMASIFWTIDSNRTAVRVETYFQLFLLSLIIWDLYLTPKALRAGMQAYIFGAYVTVSIIVLDFLTREAVNGRYGTGNDFNEVSLTLALGLPFAWYLAISNAPDKDNNRLRVLNFAYIPIALFGILLSASRGSLLATIPAFLFIIFSMSKLKTFQRVLVFSVIVASVFTLHSFVPETSIARLSETGSSISEGNLTGRGDIWKQGLAVFVNNPLLGVGSGAFRESIELGKAPHNVFVSILVDVGIVGILLFGVIIAIVVWQALIQPKLESRLWLSLMLVWGIGVMALTWEHRKMTWLLFTFVVVSANLISEPVERALRARSYSDQTTPNIAARNIDAI